MNRTLWIGIGLFAATILFVIIFLGRAGTSVKQPSTSLEPSPTTSSPAATTGGVKEIQVIGTEYSYEPSSISLKEGERVILTFRNVGRLTHNLVIDELGLSTKTVGQGESDMIEFVATSSGIFEFYCSIANHRGLGMEGSLEVR